MMKLVRIALCVALAAPADAFFRKIGGRTQRIKYYLGRRIGTAVGARMDLVFV